MDKKLVKIINEARWTDGQTARNRLDDITYNPMRSQEEFVLRMMRENSRTEYGLKNNFKSIHTLEDFRRYIPLTTYDDYAGYIGRIAQGEKNILTAYLTEYLSSQNGIRTFPQSRWSVQAFYDYSFAMAFNIAGNHSFLTEGLMLNLIDCSMEKLESGMTVLVHTL